MMIKFFRRIRKNLLIENKFSKYLIYAIGEIVLVVIGILIAVSLNNANEKRQQRESLLGIYSIVAEDLNNDFQEIDHMISDYESQEPLFLKVLDGKMTKQDYEECEKCKRLITGFTDLSIEQRGYTLLSNFQAISVQNQDSLLIAIIQFYNKHLLEIDIDMRSRSMDMENNYMYWKNNHTWWADYYLMKYSSEFIDYAVEAQDYKNRVATFYGDTYDVFLPELKIFKKEGNALRDQIFRRIETGR